MNSANKFKKICLLIFAFLMMGIAAKAEPVPYAYIENDTVLCFTVGELPEKNAWKASNTGKMSLPAYWLDYNKNIKVVRFTEEFSNARPLTCHMWFCGMTNLYKIEGIENLNTSSVTGMGYMFCGCHLLTSIDVSHFNTSNVTDMSAMFESCSGLTNLDLSHFNTSNVTNMAVMFWDCTGLTSLDLSNFNTSNVTSMNWMFYNCKSLTSLDLSHFNTSNVIDMKDMFYNCGNLTTIYCNDSWTCDSSSWMFADCNNLKGAIPYKWPKIEGTYANPETGYFTYKDYEIWVNGTQVTHTNCNDLSGISGVNGTVKYDKYTNTLILDNASITATGNNAYTIKSEMPDLKIQVKGNSTLSSANGGGIQSTGSLELCGTEASSLSVSGTTALVMTSEEANQLNVKDLDLTLDGTKYYGVLSSYSNTVMEVQGNSEVKTRGVLECYRSLKDIIIPEFYEITEPAGAYISGGKVYATDGSSVKDEWVTIKPKKYDLWIGGVQVTSVNRNNISGSNIKQGTVIYNDETKTLTLIDCSIGMDNTTGTVGIKSSIDGLTIRLVGNNNIGFVDTGIESYGDVTIVGPGKMGFVRCNTGISMTGITQNKLTIADGTKIDMSLVYTGISGNKIKSKIAGQTITIYLKTLYVNGRRSEVSIVAETSAISNMKKLVLSDGLSLTAPAGAKYADYMVQDKDDNEVKDKTVRISLLAGDVNHDGAITMADANAIVNYFLAAEKPSDFDKEIADVNGDNGITMADANQIVNAFLSGAELQAFDPANGHDYVDLGLSVKWARCNVGAEHPEDYGDHFAWGEPEPKNNYIWQTYKWCDGSYKNLTKYVINGNYGTVDKKDTLEPADDAASANWGGSWRMPTARDLRVLRDSCYWEWTANYNEKGVSGYIVYKAKAPSDMGKKKTEGGTLQTSATYSLCDIHIFLPIAGYHQGTSLYSSDGCYWSSSLIGGAPYYAWRMYFDPNHISSDSDAYESRYYGLSVRPVLP